MSGSGDITLASLNAHAWRDWHARPFDPGTAIRDLKADVIALQETWLPDGEPDLLAAAAESAGLGLLRVALRHASLASLGIGTSTARGRWGLALLTALPVSGYHVLDLGRAPGDSAHRAAQAATVTIPGGPDLRIVNTHLTHRFTSPFQLVRLTRHLATEPGPTVITGDLNMPGPVTGLAAAYRPGVHGRTYPANRPVLQLDHVLVTGGAACLAGEVLGPVGSDHLPIRARLSIR